MTFLKTAAISLAALSAVAATETASQSFSDTNGDGFLGYAEFAATVDAAEALSMLGGDKQAVLEISAMGAADSADVDRNNVEEQRAAGIRAPEDDDVPNYQSDDAGDLVDRVFEDDDD